MRDAYVRLDVVAHMIALQQIREGNHRDKVYANDLDLRSRIRLEQGSALYHAFCKILEAVEMSTVIPAYEKEKLKNLTYSAESAKEAISSYILVKE